MKEMCAGAKTILFVCCLVLALDLARSAPRAKFPDKNSTVVKSSEMEQSLEKFLNIYYDNYANRQLEDLRRGKAATRDEPQPASEDDVYETMQGDQPLIENNINQNVGPYGVNGSRYISNFSEQYREVMRNRLRVNYMEDRSRENFILFLKKNILEQLGRSNMTIAKLNPQLSSINVSGIIPILNSTNVLNDDQITEKIRSFYPSCEIPVNTDQDIWKDDDIMNLFFDFDITTSDRNANVATATLRLYRLIENGTLINSNSEDCDGEDERLLRVSIYWYTKSLKKRRVKRRLSDSKVIPDHTEWVELSVKPATKAWARGRNLGMGVHVEDQEGNTLRADKYFKGASCMQHPNQSQPLLLTPPENHTNLTELMAYLDGIQQQTYILIHTCYQQ